MATTASLSHASSGLEPLLEAIGQVNAVIRGKDAVVRQVMSAVLAGGHVLLEDVPGVGKTTLSRTIARVLGCSFSRIQFTADMLPADVLGVEILDEGRQGFRFHQGPIFSEIVLADEINRASPKTQSAMLEAMADRQVSTDRETYPLPPVFVVLATQNPTEHHGVYPLPESQLDRFMVRVSMGYPSREEEQALIQSPDGASRHLASLTPVLDPKRVLALQQIAAKIHLSEPVADYLLRIVEATRAHPDIALGCSPRGAMDFARYVRAFALLAGHDFVLPDHVKHTASLVLAHRLEARGAPSVAGTRNQARALIDDILQRTPAPR